MKGMTMPRRDGRVIVLLLCVLAGLGACSRLTFVRPNFERGHEDQIADRPVYRDTPAERGQQDVDDQLTLAADRYRRGDYAAAETHARAALAIDPRSASAVSLLALIADARGDGKAAQAYYQRTLALAPDSGEALNNYGVWLCHNGRIPESLPLFRRALAAPNYATPALAAGNLGACLLDAGQVADAEPALRQALQLDPGNAVALASMARAQFLAGRYMDARAFIERRLAAAPPTATDLHLAADIERKLGDPAAAARYEDRVRQLGAAPADVGGTP
jgi:type IV pilus assembly protein PilF